MMYYVVVAIFTIALVSVLFAYAYKHTGTKEKEVDVDEIEAKAEAKAEVALDKVAYSRILAESCIMPNFSTPVADSALDRFPNHKELWANLRKVNKISPALRECNEMDQWFVENLSELCKFGDTLAYIENYPRLMETWIANLPDPTDKELQKKLISIYYNKNKTYLKPNYVNLLCLFCIKYDLLPEIKKVILVDPRFEVAGKIYKLYHR